MPPPSNTDHGSSRLSAVGNEAIAEIRRIVREDLEIPVPVGPDSHLVRDLQLDSLGLLTVAVGLENRFKIQLREEDALGLRTAGDLARLVQLRVEASR
ncbi:MAG: acyl carrier protein [Myxococcaceae bacterium]